MNEPDVRRRHGERQPTGAFPAVRPLETLQIGFIVAGPGEPVTGSERYYFSLLRAFPAVDVASRGIVVGDPASIEDPVPGVEGFSVKRGARLDRVRRFRRAVRRLGHGADLVASHHAQHTVSVLDLIRNKPLVTHFHGPLVLEGRAERVSPRKLLMRWLAERLVYARSQRLIVLSEANSQVLQREYRVNPERIRIIPGAVDLVRFNVTASVSAARETLGWPNARKIVLAARRLAPTKGLENLIDAVVSLRRSHPDVLIVIAGTGPLLASLQLRVRERGVEQFIRFVGQLREQLPLAYRAADVSIVPSVELEGFGLSVLESLACGTPVLVTPAAGLPEAIGDLGPDLVLAGSDASDLASGIDEVLTGSRRMPDVSACVTYAHRFAWPLIAERVRNVYREIS